MADKILLRGDSKANWESVNPILSAREMVIETDTNRTKIGDGVKTYTLLPYSSDGRSGVRMDAHLTSDDVAEAPALAIGSVIVVTDADADGLYISLKFDYIPGESKLLINTTPSTVNFLLNGLGHGVASPKTDVFKNFGVSALQPYQSIVIYYLYSDINYNYFIIVDSNMDTDDNTSISSNSSVSQSLLNSLSLGKRNGFKVFFPNVGGGMLYVLMSKRIVDINGSEISPAIWVSSAATQYYP